jgi:hypothetical protein
MLGVDPRSTRAPGHGPRLGHLTHSRRNYAKAIDLLFAFADGRPLTRALLLEYRSSMEERSGTPPLISSINSSSVTQGDQGTLTATGNNFIENSGDPAHPQLPWR